MSKSNDNTCEACNQAPEGYCSTKCRRRQYQARYRTVNGRKPRYNQPHDERRTIARPVIALDGEGIDGRYVLLANNNGDYIENYLGLRTEECLRWLASLDKESLKFGFAFTYDVNMILKDLSYDHLKLLRQNSQVRWGDWYIRHYPGKLFLAKNRVTGLSCSVWDLYPFIQSSFVKFLEKFELTNSNEIERISSMKDQRSDFSNLDPIAIREYCVSECRLLEKGTSMFLELFDDMGYRTNAYYSPGTIAVLEMRKRNVRAYKSAPPSELFTLSDRGYFGGRAECSQVGPLYGDYRQYDINSAYPFAAKDVPCLACGFWRQTTDVFRYGIYRIKWRCRDGTTWGPFPWRPAKSGSLKYPISGVGVVWGVELIAGQRFCQEIEILEGWYFDGTCDHKPFAYLADLYKERQWLKQIGDGREYVLKLILNSTYGKLAQRATMNDKVPQHQCIEWAGMITATCRAMLLDQMSNKTIMVATDSILTSGILDVPIGEGLGEWSVRTITDPFIVGSGFLFGSDGTASIRRTRGIRPKDVDFTQLRSRWNEYGRDGTYPVRINRFIGYGLALQRREGMSLWRHFVSMEVEKRFSLFPRRAWVTSNPYDGRTYAPSLTDIQMAAMLDEITDKLRSYPSDDLARDLVSQASYRRIDDPSSQPDWIIETMKP